MANSLKIFGLLLYKNLLVRKRHWQMTIFLQSLVPIVLFVLIQAARDYSALPPKRINETEYPIRTQEELISEFYLGINLYYVPKNEFTTKIIKDTAKCLGLPPQNVIGFHTEEDMIDRYILLQVKDPLESVLAVVFDNYNANATQKILKYKIRHSWNIPNNLYQNALETQTEMPFMLYKNFITVQMCVDQSFIQQNKLSSPNMEMSIQQMPYPSYVQINPVDFIWRQVICMFAVVAFLIPLCIEANFAAKEKFIGVNVLMSMNGVKLYQNLLSWLITGVIFSTLYVVPILILFKHTFSSNVDPYLYYGNAFIFWLLLTTHVAHLITFGMHVAAYFSKPRFVVITLSILYTASLSLHVNMIQEGCFAILPYLGIFFPNILLYRIIEESNAYEAKLIGIQWKNIFIAGDPVYKIVGSSGFIFLFSLLGIILHIILAIYINNVLPGKYGVRKHPLYFIKCDKKNKVSLDEEAGDFDYEKMNNEDFEAVPKNVLKPGIQIRDVRKTYNTSWLRKSKVHALKGVSVDFYKGQITALLGHNGAGKTTLMSILTGLTSETEGKVFINGKNIKTDPEIIKNDLGLCPQENMVFPDLSVFEQMEFFGLLKSNEKHMIQVRHEVNELLRKLKLSEKRNFLPNQLSGGQKRRLCLGMALIGNASTVILDEPTSGMDPETRRDTWDIILKMRGERTILISTHNMEEADILGDRIAILHAGCLKSYGTPMFLKKVHGHGHVEVTLSTKSWCNPEKIMNKFDPKTQQISADSEKMVLSVPYTESLSQSLDKVESQKKKLGVTGVSVSLITLEQVFLKIVKKDDNGKHVNELFTSSIQKVHGWELCVQTTLALLQKKATYTRKNISNLLMIIILPLISVLLMALSYKTPNNPTDVYSLRLDRYRTPKALYLTNNETLGQIYKDLIHYDAEPVSQDASLTRALLNVSKQDIAEYRNDFIVSAEFNYMNNDFTANGLYSGIAMHSIPLTVNILSNLMIKALIGDDYGIEVFSQQLPNSFTSLRQENREQESVSRVLIFCSFFFPTVALFVINPLQETSTKVKQLQRMTGITSISYWGTMFIFDLLLFLLCMFAIITAFYIMDIILDIRLFQKTEILIMILILLLFGINALLLVYMFSFINKSRNTIITLLSIAPLGLVFVQYLLHEVIQSFECVKALHVFQKNFFRLIPYVSFFHGQLAFYNVALQNAQCRRIPNRINDMMCQPSVLSPFVAAPKDLRACCDLECMNGTCKKQFPYFKDFKDDMNLEANVVYLSVTSLICLAILIMLEEKIFKKLITKMLGTQLKNGCDAMDEQVKKEKHAVALEISKVNSHNTSNDKQRIKAGSANLLNTTENETNSLYLVYELSKYYGSVMAVKEINFRVKQRECFGLLGVNGAGKSTTFRMLTGEELPNSGNMYLGNADIYSNRRKYLAEMGYCPQTDAILGSLNAFDHLRLFARLRGIPKSKVELEVNKWINRLNLTACMSQPSSTYSGGNKRRLNIAMALIGNPTLVLLDEPTTGVDPAARRSLWTVLQSCQAAGQAIILTSHSMEECEALCNRLVIMVRGQLVCIGASQELKQRFGAGYDIHIKLDPSRSDSDVEAIKETIESDLTCDIRDENLGFLAYHVSDYDTTWEKMYSTMNNLKRTYSCIEDFSVLSATLEQLFIQFARGVEQVKHEKTPKRSTSQTAEV